MVICFSLFPIWFFLFLWWVYRGFSLCWISFIIFSLLLALKLYCSFLIVLFIFYIYTHELQSYHSLFLNSSSIPNLGFFFVNDRCIFFFCMYNILYLVLSIAWFWLYCLRFIFSVFGCRIWFYDSLLYLGLIPCYKKISFSYAHYWLCWWLCGSSITDLNSLIIRLFPKIFYTFKIMILYSPSKPSKKKKVADILICFLTLLFQVVVVLALSYFPSIILCLTRWMILPWVHVLPCFVV